MQNSIIPNYSVSATVDKPVVDPEEQVKIDFFFYGYGEISDHKFQLQIPPELVDGKVQFKAFKYATLKDKGLALPVCPPDINLQDPPRFQVIFTTDLFKIRDANDGTVNSERPTACGGVMYSPASMQFKVSSNASPGDHPVSSRFIYRAEKEWRIAEATVNVKVRSFGERNQNALGASLAVLLFIVPLLVSKTQSKYHKWIYALTGALIAILLLFFLRK